MGRFVRYWFVGLVVLAAGGIVAFLLISDPARTGFEPAVIDFGVRQWGQRIPFEVTFANNDQQPLSVERVDASCDCTVVKQGVVGTSIEPRGALVVAGTFDTGRDIGQRSSTLTLVSSDGRRYDCHVRAQVQGSFELSPAVVELGDVDIDAQHETIEAAVAFASETNEVMHVKSEDGGEGWLEAQMRTDHGIKLSIQPGRLSPGSNVGRVVVRTSSKEVPIAFIPVTANGISQMRLQAFPRRLYLDGEPQHVHFTDGTEDRVQLRAALIEDGDGMDAQIVGDNVVRVHSERSATDGRLRVEDHSGRVGYCTIVNGG